MFNPTHTVYFGVVCKSYSLNAVPASEFNESQKEVCIITLAFSE